ncbi:MAG: AMP-binding protein [Alphaproteobacteria bacterium]|nr:AMP-binding protein [Alphaproteobacteria bacterium]MCB9931306.1 AMP-binding protein [Alphaproteobacteria bacterium]
MTDTLEAGYEIRWAAEQFRDRPAVVFRQRTYTFREVNARANRLANGLRSLGLETGDRVGVLVNNSIHSVDAVFGLLKGAFCIVALNSRHAGPEHLGILTDAGCRAVIVAGFYRDIIEPVLAHAPDLKHVIGIDWQPPQGLAYDAFLEGASDAEPRLEVPADTICRLTYTSGSTGKPKGVVGTHRRHLARLANFFQSCEYALGPDQTMGQVGPLSHVAGNYLQPCFVRGAKTIIFERFDPLELQSAIERHRINHLLLVPTMIVRFVAALEPETYNLSSLTRINYGTAPIPVDVLRRGLEVLGPVFRQHYGMSEANSPLTLLYPGEHVTNGSEAEAARLASCGRPILAHRIVVRSADGADLPAGEVGEICIRAEGAASFEYWQRPDLTAAAIRDGWFHTGDLGRFDADGYLFIVGRTKDMIITGGFNVYAREVEDALFAHPDVLEAAVVGLPDPDLGERIAAMVVPKPGQTLDEAALTAHCRRLIAGYKVPRHWAFADELPKTASAKVAKQTIRDDLLARFGAEGAVTGVQASYD